jgi:hypothetical protein
MSDPLVEALAALVRSALERWGGKGKGPGEGQVDPTAAPPKGEVTIPVRRSASPRQEGGAP